MSETFSDAARQRELYTMTKVLERELGSLVQPEVMRELLDAAVAEVGGEPDAARRLRLRVGSRVLEALSDRLEACARASQRTVQVPLAMLEPRPVRMTG